MADDLSVSVDHNGLCFTCPTCGERVCHTWQGAESSTVDCPTCGTTYHLSVSVKADTRTSVDKIMWEIVALGWEARIADTPDPYERDDWHDAEARRAGKRRWTQLSPSDHVQVRGASRQEAAERLLERVREKNAARSRLEGR